MTGLKELCDGASQICGCNFSIDNLSKEFRENFPTEIGTTRSGVFPDQHKFDMKYFCARVSQRVNDTEFQDVQEALEAAHIFSDFAVFAGHARPGTSIHTEDDCRRVYLAWSNMGWYFYKSNNVIKVIEVTFPAWIEKEEKYELSFEKMDEWPTRLIHFIATARFVYTENTFLE